MVAEPLTMGAYMPVITDADRLIWLVRGMSAGEFTRQFRNGLPAPELLRLIAAPPSDRIDELQERARLAAARAARQALAQGEGLPLAQAIRVAREQAGMDQAELAEVLGVHSRRSAIGSMAEHRPCDSWSTCCACCREWPMPSELGPHPQPTASRGNKIRQRIPGRRSKRSGRGGRATSPPAVASTDRSQCRQADDTAILARFFCDEA